jgi:hypothetical protein
MGQADAKELLGVTLDGLRHMVGTQVLKVVTQFTNGKRTILMFDRSEVIALAEKRIAESQAQLDSRKARLAEVHAKTAA